MDDKDARTWASLIHASPLLNMVMPPLGWAAAVTIWLLKRDQSPYVDQQGKEELNFTLTLFGATVILGMALVALSMLAGGMLGSAAGAQVPAAETGTVAKMAVGGVAGVFAGGMVGMLLKIALLGLVFLYGVVMRILAAVACSKGQEWRYPLTVRLVA